MQNLCISRKHSDAAELVIELDKFSLHCIVHCLLLCLCREKVYCVDYPDFDWGTNPSCIQLVSWQACLPRRKIQTLQQHKPLSSEIKFLAMGVYYKKSAVWCYAGFLLFDCNTFCTLLTCWDSMTYCGKAWIWFYFIPGESIQNKKGKSADPLWHNFSIHDFFLYHKNKKIWLFWNRKRSFGINCWSDSHMKEKMQLYAQVSLMQFAAAFHLSESGFHSCVAA